MKLRVLCGLLCLPVLIAGAGDVPSVGLTCAQAVYDFGKKKSTEEVRHVFMLENKGSSVIRIRKVSTGCSCTTGHLSTNEVAAGQTAGLEVIFKLSGRQGQQRKNVYVVTDAPGEAVCTLSMCGEIEAAVPDVTVQPLPVESVTISNQATSTGGPSFREISRSTVADRSEKAGSAYITVPQEVLIAAGASGSNSVTRYVTIRRRDRTPFKILSLTGPAGATVSVQENATAGAGQLIKVENLTPFALSTNASITIMTDEPSDPQVIVPVRHVTN